jgi:hypothetical protein
MQVIVYVAVLITMALLMRTASSRRRRPPLAT